MDYEIPPRNAIIALKKSATGLRISRFDFVMKQRKNVPVA